MIAEANYADHKIKMEYERKKLEIDKKVAKAKARAKVLNTFGDVSLQKYKKEDQLLTEEDKKKVRKHPY